MKKNIYLPGILGIVTLLAILGMLLFPIGVGLVLNGTGTGAEVTRGYDFVFGNEAAYIENHGAMIAWFVLGLIAAAFVLLATAFGFKGGKFTGFLHTVAGLCLFACTILVFLSPVIIGNWVGSGNASVSLGWGYICTGICSAIAAVVSLFNGVTCLKAKD